MPSPDEDPFRGLLDELLAQLPLFARVHFFFGWATLFSKDPNQDEDITKMISTITVVDFTSFRRLEVPKFQLLAHLTFTPHILRLSHCILEEKSSKILKTIATSPIFNELRVIDFSACNLESIDDLFSGPNIFPDCHTLILKQNEYCDLTSLKTTDKLPKLTTLDLSNTKLDESSVRALAESKTPVFKIEHLDLGWNLKVSDDDVIALIRSPHFANLKSLRLPGIPFSIDSIKSLVEDRGDGDVWLNKLEVFHSLSSGIDDSCIALLAESPILSNITTLDLGSCFITTKSIKSIAKSPYLTKLTHLLFHNNSFSISPLLPHLKAPLKTLSLSHCTVLLRDIEAMTINCNLFELENLNLSQLRIAVPGDSDSTSPDALPFNPQFTQEAFDLAMTKLSQSPIISNLTHLNIRQRGFGPWIKTESVKELLLSSLLSSKLTDLNLSNCPLDEECCKILATQRIDPNDPQSPLKFGQIQKLHLFHCNLTPSCFQWLVQLESLTFLDLESNPELGDVVLTSFLPDTSNEVNLAGHSFLFPSNLTDLCLSTCSITDKGLAALAQSQLLDQLQSLEIGFNEYTDVGLQLLRDAPQVSRLASLSFSPPSPDSFYSWPHLINTDIAIYADY